MKRIEKFFADLKKEGMTDSEIAAGLGNGEIEKPEWLAISEEVDHIKACDFENGESFQMGFCIFEYAGG